MMMKELTRTYISYRRSIGEKYKTGGNVLDGFTRFVGENKNPRAISLTDCTSFLYGKNNRVTASWFIRYATLKGLFEWALARGYVEQVPLPDDKPKSIEHMTPYVYSYQELEKLFDTALTFQKHKSKIPPECIQAIIKLTYFLGLRISETLSLKVCNIDLKESVATIRETKFNKTRIVPFNRQVNRMIRSFLKWRATQHPDCGDDCALFLDREGNPFYLDTVQDCFQRIRKKAGIRRFDDAYFQPRIHDLRHSFAVHRLTAWYREGKDVQRYLCHLSTYLGHSDLSHTSVYLSMTDNLLREASNLFESYSYGEKS